MIINVEGQENDDRYIAQLEPGEVGYRQDGDNQQIYICGVSALNTPIIIALHRDPPEIINFQKVKVRVLPRGTDITLTIPKRINV